MVDATRHVTLLGRYRLEDLIGQGGMGSVHRATDLKLEREVAVKVVSPHANNAETRTRFLREAQRTAQIRHPNVVEVFDVGETESGELFFVMELLRGEALSARLKREGRVAMADFVRIAGEICDGVGAAHALGVVHRDIKPANVMLVQHGNRRDLVKLLDFGIAKAENASTHLTEAGMFLGTLEYVAPEQILGTSPLDTRADVYAIGSLFYRMLTGAALFPDVGRTGLIHHHLEVMPMAPAARAVDAHIAPALSDLVLRCLAKAPGDRPQTANDLRLELDAALSGTPGSSAPRVARAPKQEPAGPGDLDAATVAMAIPTFNPAPVRAMDFELAPPSPARGGGTELMARPLAQTCGRCGKIIAPTASTCAGCGASRSTPGSLHAPLEEIALVKVKRAQPMTLVEGPPAWLVPLGLLPSWIGAVLALLCLAGFAGLWAFQVDARGAYWGLGVVFFLALLGIYVRRRLDAADG